MQQTSRWLGCTVARYSHILWDWNGTLLDDSQVCVDTLNSVLRPRQIGPIALEHYRSVFQFPVFSFYKTIAGNLSEQILADMSREFVENYADVWQSCRLHHEAPQTLRHFRKLKISQNILSASDQETLDRCLNHFELTEFFDRIIGQDNSQAHGKLDTARRWLKQERVSPEKVLLIGDTLHDLEIAQELGFDCELFSKGHNSKDRLRDAHHRVIECLSELRS